MADRTQGEDVSALATLLETQRQIAQTEYMMGQLVSGQARIEQHLVVIEARLAESLTPAQLVKLLTGIGLPLAVLWMTGDVGAALRFLSGGP